MSGAEAERDDSFIRKGESREKKLLSSMEKKGRQCQVDVLRKSR